MRATQEFTTQKGLAEIEGWVVAGASKRGWTTWMVGAATCESCPTIKGIAPLVPIVPNLRQEMHRQWQSYNGWTFAFADYIACNLTQKVDDPEFLPALEIIDPMYYLDRLARIPKVVVLSSNDEFMQFDWSNIWYDELKGEKHLLIVQNSEHSLSTAIPELLPALGTVIRSIAQGNDEASRPSFDYTYNNKTGAISVTIPADKPQPKGSFYVTRKLCKMCVVTSVGYALQITSLSPASGPSSPFLTPCSEAIACSLS
jgi:PhoPQ-activated pathogenicity-related protein